MRCRPGIYTVGRPYDIIRTVFCWQRSLLIATSAAMGGWADA